MVGKKNEFPKTCTQGSGQRGERQSKSKYFITFFLQDPLQKMNTNNNTRFDKGLVIKLDAGLRGINLQSLQTKQCFALLIQNGRRDHGDVCSCVIMAMCAHASLAQQVEGPIGALKRGIM